MPSKTIAFVAALFAILWGALDVNYHGHFSCGTNLKLVRAELEKRTHLEEYLKPQNDYSGQPETGTVKCDCVAGRKVVLTGKVVNENLRREFSDVAAMAVGTDQVDNQIETLNVEALSALQDLLKSAPTKMTMNYQVRDRGTIYLTGDLPSPELKERITTMVQRIRGVRSVVNDLGKEIQVQRMLRIHNIYFDFNQWKIRAESNAVLDEVAQKIEEYVTQRPAGTVRIEGHTDSIASNEYNLWLSQKRADAVLKALTDRGIAKERLKAMGKGETKLLVSPDDTPEKRAENRRIEFYFE